MEPSKINVGENEVTWFATVDDGFASMLQAIGSARTSIDLEMYIYRDDEMGRTFRVALLEAQARGVKIRIMLDGLGSVSLPSNYWDGLIALGAEFRRFNPISLTGPLFRNHRKLLTVDTRIGIIGGFNIADEYRGDGVEHGWHDCGCRIEGPAGTELVSSFERMWMQSERRPRLLSRWRRSNAARIDMKEGLSLLLTGPGRPPFLMQNSFLADMKHARSIDIISAYFLPPRKLRKALVHAARSGVKVRLVLAGKSDVQVARLAAHRLYRTLLKAGVEIYEYQPQILHTKFYLIDHVAYVGSANMDIRSLRINFELLTRCENKALAESMRPFFDQALTLSKRILLEEWNAERSLWVKIKEEWAWLLLARLDPWLSQLHVSALRHERPEQQPGD